MLCQFLFLLNNAFRTRYKEYFCMHVEKDILFSKGVFIKIVNLQETLQLISLLTGVCLCMKKDSDPFLSRIRIRVFQIDRIRIRNTDLYILIDL